MKKSKLLIVQILLGMVLGVGGFMFLMWDSGAFGKAPLEFKIGSAIFLIVVGFCFFMAHRTPDKEGLDYKVTR